MKETLKVKCHPSRETFWHLEAKRGVEDECARPPKAMCPHAKSLLHDPRCSSFKSCHVSSSPPNPNPCMTSSPQSVTFWPPKASCWASRGMGEVLPRNLSGLQRHSSSSGVWAMVSNLWASSPKEAQARLVLPKMSTNKVLQRQ
jgi:hypothetical protein